MKLFHFLPEKWALEAVKNQRIKVSRYSDFNDPFELTAMSLDDKFHRSVVIENKKKMDRLLRVLCCSGSWHSPLLWAHYGDKHKGIALELEVPNVAAEAILYRKSRKKIDLDELFSKADEEAKRRFFKLCNTKYIEWSYEDEYRIQFTEDEFYTNDEHDFYNLGKEIKITGLVLGALNKSFTQDMLSPLIKNGSSVTVTTTRTAFKSFNIVRRKDKPKFTVHGGS